MNLVYFNTDFVYNLGSDGIITFGGEEDGLIDINTVTWKKKDISFAFSVLKKIQDKFGLQEIDLSIYKKSKEGTEILFKHLQEKVIPKEYLVGFLICHQLLYQIPLQATYMTGMPNEQYGSDSDYL
jgi:hypothetical protein